MQNNFEILPVASDDLVALGEMLLRSKLTLTINRLLWKDWPNEAAQRPQYRSAVEGAFTDATFDNFKVVDSSTQRMVGYMAMARKKPSASSPQDPPSPSEAQTLPDGINKDVCGMVFEAVGEIENEWQNQDRYELVFIVVEQSYRRRGIGSKLMQKCFDKVKAASIPLVTCSEPAANAFFAELGFRDTKHADMDLSKWAPPFSGFGTFRLTGMVWRPGSSDA